MKSTKKNQGKRNRTAGHNYERQLAKEHRDILGEESCKTSRQASRLLDECKVDLNSTFHNLQAKNVRNNIDYHSLILEIRDLLKEHFPERLDLPTAVFHKKRGKEVVALLKDDYYKLLLAAFVQPKADVST